MPDERSASDNALSGSLAELTLNAEVHRICIAEGGYPTTWPRHLKCPCCGRGDLKSIFSKYQFNHDQCTDCGFVCVNPYPPKNIVTRLYGGSYYTNFREFYEAKYLREVGDYSMTAAPMELLERMIARATAGRTVGDWLDVGGGLGTVADLVRQRCPGWAVTLNEFNPRSVELARQIYGLDVVSNDAGELQKMARRFDVISAVSVLEHITDPLEFLNAYASLLKADGIMAIIVPHFTYLNAAVSRAASPVTAPPFHASLFQEHSLRVILERVNEFKEFEVSQFGRPAFSLLHHYDTSEYWDASIPTADEPIPKCMMVKEYPPEISGALNALAQAEQVLGDYFGEVDGRLYVMAVAHRGSRESALRLAFLSGWSRLRVFLGARMRRQRCSLGCNPIGGSDLPG
jgi:SAM-dependent methyltransferase